MNYFLIVVILCLGAAGYFEYTQFQQKAVAAQEQVADAQDKVDQLQNANKKLTDDNATLTKSADDAQDQITDLTKKLKDAQNALAVEKAEEQQAKAPATPAAATVKPPSSNNLGTITSLDGKTYANCQLLKVKEDGIVVNDADGITEVAYTMLPPDLQKRFGFDPHVSATLSEAQIEADEKLRQAASGPGH